MIIVTSLSPNHSNKDNQKAAVESWGEVADVISMNSKSEVESLRDYECDNLQISTLCKTIESIIGKPLVNINDMFDWRDNTLIINSDIILKDLPELKQDGITMFSRYDMDTGEIFKAGFDVFYIPYQFLEIFPPSIYAMGAAWWDYWIPYRAILAGVPLYWPTGKHAFHKSHPTQYNNEEWLYIGEYFKWEFKFNKKLIIGEVATQAIETIKSRAIRI